MEFISSVQNEKVKAAVKLQSSKARSESGTFVVEGAKLISENGTECLEVSEAVIKKLSALTTPQDHIAVFKAKPNSFQDPDENFILALDRLQDPQNIGAIFRSAEAFGTRCIVLSPDCCDPYSPKALRAAMGSTFRLTIVIDDLRSFIEKCKSKGYCIIGTGLDKNADTPEILKNDDKKILIIGNEGSGMSEAVKDKCDRFVFIPMSGQNESLNAAVAASILLWETRKAYDE